MIKDANHTSYVPPSRAGKKHLNFYVDADVLEAFNAAKKTLGISIDTLGHMALRSLFQRIGITVPDAVERQANDRTRKLPGPQRGTTYGPRRAATGPTSTQPAPSPAEPTTAEMRTLNAHVDPETYQAFLDLRREQNTSTVYLVHRALMLLFQEAGVPLSAAHQQQLENSGPKRRGPLPGHGGRPRKTPNP